jgi:probable phosphoglycerate mutase
MIYLLRHGTVKGSEQRLFIGGTDTPLAEKGKEQARQWRRLFHKIEFETIYCSDLKRSEETARIIAGDNQVSIRVVQEFREICLGQWEGLSMDFVRRRFPEQWRRRGENLADYPPPGGETFREFQNRVVPAFEAVAGKLRGHGCIIAHAGVNRVILSHLLGMPLPNIFRLSQDYGALNIIEYGTKSPRVLALNIHPGQFQYLRSD